MLPPKKIVLLDGTPACDKQLSTILAVLNDTLVEQSADIQIFTLKNVKINHCIGCFSCWDKTPGRCIYDDEGVAIIKEVLRSDTVIIFTPLVFGGYSSELKKIIDRFLPLALPFFREYHGETRHVPRYPTTPRFVWIAGHQHPQKDLSQCFKMLAGRNAANFYLPSYAAEVVNSSTSPEKLCSQLRNVLDRNDKLPEYKELALLMHNIASGQNIPSIKDHALLIVGSHKINKPSTSAMLGEILMSNLRQYGWSTEVITLNRALLQKEQQDTLCSAFERAETIVISFPLYCDTIPYLTIKALEIIAQHVNQIQNGRIKNLFVIANNGYPEAHHNISALSICRFFALETGINWAGGLALGAGEILLSGAHPVTSFTGFKGVKRPPLYNINKSLKITAKALANGYPIPKKALQLMSNPPIPLVPSKLWRWFLIKEVNKLWNKEARKIGMSKQKMIEKPFVE